MKLLWKCLREGLKSNYDGSKWVIGEWRVEKPPKYECNGLNACPRLIDAMRHVAPEIVALVEVGGKVIKGNDKHTCEQMRIVKAYKWEKKDSVAMSIFSAELAIGNYESVFPNDNRPRKAIEAAKKYLEDPTEENRQAAWSAAWSAESAAWSAAWSAESAAWSAGSAAWSAARSAAWSAESAADECLDKIEAWLMERVKTLEEIT